MESKEISGNEGSFISLEHWYEPGTNCSYLLNGSPSQIVRLHFQKMKISQKTKIKPDNSDCGEYLILYDSDWANPQKIIKAFCSSFSEPKENIDYITTGSSMFINFVSNSGSYSGSSIYYWAIYDFHESSLDGDKVEDAICDEVFHINNNQKRTFQSPRNSLIYKNSQKDFSCSYRIVSNEHFFSRISLTITELNFKSEQKRCKQCWNNNDFDKIEIHDPQIARNLTESCFIACKENTANIIYSKGTEMSLKMRINHKTARMNYYKSKKPVFTARYSFLHPPVCGPVSIEAKEKGFLTFPVLQHPNPSEDIECLWDLNVKTNKLFKLTVSFLFILSFRKLSKSLF